jgi:hypothetical protein
MRSMLLSAVVAAALVFPSVCAAGTFEELLNKSPAGANVALVVNVEQIMASDYAKSQGSEEKLAAAFAEREILIPPSAKHFALVAQVDLERHRPVWEAALMELSAPADFKNIAKELNGTVEMIGGAQAVGTRRAFIVDLGDDSVGLLLPSNRQEASRWLKQVKGKSGALAPYLTEATSFSDTAGTDIILAIELADMFPAKFLAEKLRESELLKDNVGAIAPTAELLTTIQGARLGIKVGEKCYGKLIVDFSEDPSSLGELAKPILLHAIGGAGIMLEEFPDWKASFGKKSIAIEGTLSQESMSRLMSLVNVPTDSVNAVTAKAPAAAPPAETEPAAPKPTPISAVAEASRTYYKTIDKQLTSLRLKQNEAKTFGQIALWINNAARRIDRMPTLNVDPELLEFGTQTSAELREMAVALQGIGINSAEREASAYGGETYYAGWDGYYYSGTDHQAEKREIRAQERAAGARSAREIATKLANDEAAMRIRMTEKYKLQF